MSCLTHSGTAVETAQAAWREERGGCAVQVGQGSGSWGHWGDVEGMGQYWRGWVDATLRVAGNTLTGWRWLSWCRSGGEGRRGGTVCAVARVRVAWAVVPMAAASMPGRQRCCAAVWRGPGFPHTAAGRVQGLLGRELGLGVWGG